MFEALALLVEHVHSGEDFLALDSQIEDLELEALIWFKFLCCGFS